MPVPGFGNPKPCLTIATGIFTGYKTYMVNLNSKKFHYPNCASVSKMAEKNKWLYEGTREWLIENGYDPCKNCNP